MNKKNKYETNSLINGKKQKNTKSDEIKWKKYNK